MEALHRFCLYPKFSYSKYQILKSKFSTFDQAWDSTRTTLIACGFDEDAAHQFIEWRNNFTEQAYQEILTRDSISIITIEDSQYPSLLAQIFDPPVALFTRGFLNNARPRVAVVGTRKMTTYGRHSTEEMVSELAAHRIEIVSGLALGIDGIAHKTALTVHGNTTAVLGSGVDESSIYPRAHYGLAQSIIDNGGALVSEYPPGSAPTPYSFPRRNRIIAGISLGTLVIEADEQSGALITALCALEYGRDVYAIPHPITSPTGKGPHKLIRDGAYLVQSAQDILENLPIQDFIRHAKAQEILPDTPDEALIITQLAHEPRHIDELMRSIALPSHKITALLTLLEMKGKIKNIGNMTYTITRR